MYVDLEMIELFEELESIINNASSIPFSQKSGIDKNEVLGIIGEIKVLIPEEVKQATWINKERHKIINDAKQEAAKLVDQANKEAERVREEYNDNIEELKKNSEDVIKAYVEASEPVVKAEQQAKDIIDRAERVANEIRLGSIEYADNILSSVEYNLKSVLEEVSRDRAELNPER
ncbi:hypothetical protein [Romboutsia sp.]|uniref:hypothetical protein n=1 Tax=Romboutsia sp. TaxID=1965302 RepID=UPI002C662569|nr:hypothetical protein [Romboutsia sp.]HSQ87753.1 hypothetical protein [Romboutsia sp.]